MTAPTTISPGPVRACRPPVSGARRAFTLVELLVVISIIALLGGLIGQALTNKGGGGLAAAQGTLGGLLNFARSEAALTQGNARLLIYAMDPTADETRYLTQVQVVVPDPTTPGNWITKGDIVTLPPGTYVVPPNPPVVPVPLGALAWPVASPTLNSSNLSPGTLKVDGATLTTNYFYVEFSPLGTLNGTAANGFLLVLASGQAHVPGDSTDTQPVRFTNPNDVRGLQVSQYGVETFLNDVTDFQ